MNSIIQKDRECCFLCGMNANLEPLDEHHVFFGPNRKNSEKYGLKVYLHHNRCHIFGARSVHQNAKVDKAIKRVVQKRAMKHYGWTIEQFREIFGKNYID
jgi:hypothetical protein